MDVDDRKSSSQSTDSSEEKSNSSKNSPNSEQKTVSKATTPNDTKSDSTEKSERAEKKYDSNNSAIEAANDAKKDGKFRLVLCLNETYLIQFTFYCQAKMID